MQCRPLSQSGHLRSVGTFPAASWVWQCSYCRSYRRITPISRQKDSRWGIAGEGALLYVHSVGTSLDTWSPSQSPIFLHPGKKRVWVPDEQDAYVEAEIKTEATGGKVTVETKDQKVELPLH